MNEIERFGRWSRIAPAFSAGTGSFRRSKEELIDHCLHTKRNTWFRVVYGKMVYQSAPAIMSRNMPLPTVKAMKNPPYVMASTYPTGALAIATEGRVLPEDTWFEPRGNITVQVKDASQPIGIFGHYNSLTLTFSGSLNNIKHLWAQDLLSNQATDILSQVTIKGNTLTLPGKLIDTLGTSAGDKGDISVPGMVLLLEGSDLPVAGDGFTPKPAPLSLSPASKSKNKINNSTVQGFAGTATIKKEADGFRVSASQGKVGTSLRKLKKSIDHGKVTFTWKMKPTASSATKNGFLVISGDPDATNAVFAGSWIASKEITVFEQSDQWGKAKKKSFQPGKELNCKAILDMDARTLTLTINGTTTTQAFSEAITTVDYIGFAVKGANTHFTNPTVTRAQSMKN